MQASEPFFKMLEHALYVVLDAPAPDWDEHLEKLDARIRKIEAWRRANEPKVTEHVRGLEAQRHSLEASLFASSIELEKAKEDLEREIRRERELEGRLVGFEKHVLRVLKDK
jgi:hypothetical protein